MAIYDMDFNYNLASVLLSWIWNLPLKLWYCAESVAPSTTAAPIRPISKF